MKVCCDAPGCGWEKEEHVAQMQQWHNAACPACGHSPVLSDQDMTLLDAMVSMRDLGWLAIGSEAKLDKPSICVTVNTGPLRKGSTP